MTEVRFRALLELGGKTATGIEVPAGVLDELGAGRRPAVLVTLDGYRYRTTVGSMAGRAMIPVSAEHRNASGLAAGQQVEVTLEPDTAPREVALPEDLAALLAADDQARSHFETLAPSRRKEWVTWVESAKKPETRDRRLQATIEGLRAGRSTH